MKSLSFSIVLLFGLLFSNAGYTQTAIKKEAIKVWGNCGMCKKTIEKAAKSAGATTASWNEETKQLNVAYSAKKTNSVKIQQAVAKSGYDTQDYTAEIETYNNLHGCCQYDRKDAGIATNLPCCSEANCDKSADKCKEAACCQDKSCCKK